MGYFEEVMAEGKRNVKVVINLLLNDLLRVLNKDDVTLDNRFVIKISFTYINLCHFKAI